MPYRLSEYAKMDLARIYWRGVNQFGARQAEVYYLALVQRLSDLADAPYQYPAVDHIREGYRRSVCGVDSIYYRINAGVVEIMRIIGRQDTEDLP